MDYNTISLIRNLNQKLKDNQVIVTKVDEGQSIVLIHSAGYDTKLLKFLKESGALEDP